MVMVKSTLLIAMMVTTSMVMDAAEIVMSKLDSHAMADHQTLEMPAQ